MARPSGPSESFRFGIEVLLERRPRWLRTEAIGLVCHPASVNRALVHSSAQLHAVAGRRLRALFGPQHGARGEKQDNMIESRHFQDAWLRIPVWSLYSRVREPTVEMLRGIDVLLVDLQDVGTRVYTFVSTMIACLRVASRTQRRVVILDRPNPISGLQAEGHVLQPSMRSFVGELPGLPMRHGLTMGELALWANERLGIGCELEVVRMRGWRRSAYWDDLALHWVAPSPNMPSLATAICYPGTVLFEGTNVSEGRGTTQPFELIGAPFVDPVRLTTELRHARLAGVTVRPLYFEPTFQKWSGQLCGGVQLHVLHRRQFRPYQTALHLLASIQKLWPREFAWRRPPYEYETERWPIDIIAGTDQIREHLSRFNSASRIAKDSRSESARFAKSCQASLLYD